MRGINRFFYRFDIIKNTYFGISIPMMLACWFYPVGFLLFLLLPISTVGLVLGLLKIPIPKEESIVKYTFEIHKEYAARIKRIHNEVDEHYDMLGGYARKKEIFCRRIGSRAVYPMCRTLVFANRDESLELYVKDSPLMEGLSPQEWHFSLTEPINASFEEHKNGFVLSFLIDGDEVLIIASDKHKLADIMRKYKRYFIFDESILHGGV